jgi:predicted ATP-dependent endonuclease of OLD family
MDLRITIQSTISQLFDMELNIDERSGQLYFTLYKKGFGEKYDLRMHESSGLKQIISLLVFLYDDSYDFLIIDEPELHLHPQFQMFLLNEMRKIIDDPNTNPNKCFFIFTHSPNFIDIRDIADIENCVIFHHNTPTFISQDDVNADNKYDLESLIPKLNSYLKQFLFATDPVFVEGNTDQQIFSLILNKINIPFDAVGHSILDVGGKEKFAFFYKINKLLKINAKFIADLDIIFYKTKLLQSISKYPIVPSILKKKVLRSL